MNSVRILDCTLRDGGYVNGWNFGKDKINTIIEKLVSARIDIIECGFLTNSNIYDSDHSKYNSITEINTRLIFDSADIMYVCMINYGEYNLYDIPEKKGNLIEGIRVAFHKEDLLEALEFARGVKEKGYKLFLQPMVSNTYEDLEFIELIKLANKIEPYAFYIVDSFGVMKKNDLMRLYYLVDHNLDKTISIGFHSHNNLQLSFSNAQALTEIKTDRDIIIDASVFGMGRGAGNLNTELFVEHLNSMGKSNYNLNPLLQIIDQVLKTIYFSNYWGYSLAHYISSKYNCHPNYASYLEEKSTLSIEDISNILSKIPLDKRHKYDRQYIESLYNQYQEHKIDDVATKEKLKALFKGKTANIIAPGRSIEIEKNLVQQVLSEENTITISVNFRPEQFIVDFVFFSNVRRFEQYKDNENAKLILTSNIKKEENDTFYIDYESLTNKFEYVRDNAAMMLIKLLAELEVAEIRIAGLDGYSYNAYLNYAVKDMALANKNDIIDAINAGMMEVLKEFSSFVKISFITKKKYLDFDLIG